MVSNLARTWSARLVEPVARFLAALGLTPNGVTVIGFFLTVGVAVVLATGRVQLAGFLLIVTLAFDAVDGALARLMGLTSRFGAFLDSTLDRWAEIALFLALAWRLLQTGDDLGVMLAGAAMASSLMVSYTRARAEGVGLQCKEGLLTRFERVVLLIAGLIFNRPVWALTIIAVFAAFTAVQRIFVTRRAAQNAK
jgi:CDP-diacylglycerol--glycerol-3-phosphate 3-phosphatidyltransferase